MYDQLIFEENRKCFVLVRVVAIKTSKSFGFDPEITFRIAVSPRSLRSPISSVIAVQAKNDNVGYGPNIESKN